MHVNKSKCEIFATGIDEDTLNRRKDFTGFVIGSLPIKYLGVPLISKRISIKDCKPLIDKITTKIHHWTTKSLSYARRLQLVQSIHL